MSSIRSILEKLLAKELGCSVALLRMSHDKEDRDNMDKALKDISELIDGVIGEDERGETVQVPCPDGIPGCCVYHTAEMKTPRIKDRNELRAEQRNRKKELLK